MTVFTRAQKPSGETYEITRKIIVKEKGKEGENPRKDKKQKKEQKNGEEDAEPDGANLDTSALKKRRGCLIFRCPVLHGAGKGKGFFDKRRPHSVS